MVEDRTLPHSSKALMSGISTYRYLISRWAEIGPGRWFDGVCCERKSAQKTPTLDEGNAAQRCGFLSAPPFSALATATSKKRGRNNLAAPELVPPAYQQSLESHIFKSAIPVEDPARHFSKAIQPISTSGVFSAVNLELSLFCASIHSDILSLSHAYWTIASALLPPLDHHSSRR